MSSRTKTHDWKAIESQPGFKALLAAKRRFLIPMSIFFLAYYFALPILVGYAPDLMNRPVIGKVNLAYLFAFSQFIMAWAVAVIYLRAAARFDAEAHKLVNHIIKEEAKQP